MGLLDRLLTKKNFNDYEDIIKAIKKSKKEIFWKMKWKV